MSKKEDYQFFSLSDKHPDTLKYLVDVTVAYPGGRPLDLQTLVGGWRPPCDTIFHYRRFNIEEVIDHCYFTYIINALIYIYLNNFLYLLFKIRL